MASTTLARAPSFSRGATESSRSRNVMSAGIVGPLARKRSLEPGTERQERRGRSRVRADMPGIVLGEHAAEELEDPLLEVHAIGLGPGRVPLARQQEQLVGDPRLDQGVDQAGAVPEV